MSELLLVDKMAQSTVIWKVRKKVCVWDEKKVRRKVWKMVAGMADWMECK